MKKNYLNKITGLLLVGALSVSSFVACGSSDAADAVRVVKKLLDIE